MSLYFLVYNKIFDKVENVNKSCGKAFLFNLGVIMKRKINILIAVLVLLVSLLCCLVACVPYLWC